MLNWENEDWFSLVLSLLLIPLGLIPILNKFNVTKLELPGFLSNEILLYIVAVIGLWMIYIGWQEADTMFKHPTWAIGLLIFALGLVNVLQQFDVINFAGAENFSLIMNGVYAIVGILLFISLWVDKY